MSAARDGFDAGFSLIEVLVAAVVLAIGLLGLARLQVAGIRNLNTAGYRYNVSEAVADLGERLRANAASAACVLGATGTECQTTGNETAYTREINRLGQMTSAQLAASDASLADQCTAVGAPCTPPALAALDAFRFVRNANQAIPEVSMRADIVRDAGNLPTQPVTYQILMLWREPGFSQQMASAASAADPHCTQQTQWMSEQQAFFGQYQASHVTSGVAGIRCLIVAITP